MRWSIVPGTVEDVQPGGLEGAVDGAEAEEAVGVG